MDHGFDHSNNTHYQQQVGLGVPILMMTFDFPGYGGRWCSDTGTAVLLVLLRRITPAVRVQQSFFFFSF